MSPKLLLPVIFLLLSGSMRAQFKKNDRLIGASIATGYFSSGKTDYDGYVTFSHAWNASLTPNYGWFLSSRSVIGASLILNMSGQKNWNESGGLTYKRDIRKNMDYGLGSFFRYYVTEGSRWLPFVHGYANGGSGNTKTSGFYYSTSQNQTYSGRSSKRSFYNLGINAGITRMLNKNAGLDLFIGYGHSYSKMTTTTHSVSSSGTTTITEDYIQPQAFTGNAINLGIGFQLYITK